MGSKNLGEILLHPTKIYVKEILELQKNINLKAIAHITGGGLIGNLKRIIPEKIEINLFKNSLFNFNKKLFSLIQEASNLSDEEMLNTFNCGNGMVIVISENELEKTKKILIELKIGYKIIGVCSNLKKGNSLVNIN